MSSAELSRQQVEEISRAGIKKLIKKYSDSQGKDGAALSMLLEQIAKTPLYFAVEHGGGAGRVNFITLTVGGRVFIPIFTDPDEFGRLADRADCVCLAPSEYFRYLADNGRHAVINPFGSYFLMWPELVREHMLPYMKQAEEFRRQQEEKLPRS